MTFKFLFSPFFRWPVVGFESWHGSGCMVYLKLIGSRYRMWRAAGQLGDSWQGGRGGQPINGINDLKFYACVLTGYRALPAMYFPSVILDGPSWRNDDNDHSSVKADLGLGKL